MLDTGYGLSEIISNTSYNMCRFTSELIKNQTIDFATGIAHTLLHPVKTAEEIRDIAVCLGWFLAATCDVAVHPLKWPQARKNLYNTCILASEAMSKASPEDWARGVGLCLDIFKPGIGFKAVQIKRR